MLQVIQLILSFIVMGLMYGIGSDQSDEYWKKEISEKGFAEHDSKTGEWKWKEGK